jgi:hypothetical protein
LVLAHEALDTAVAAAYGWADHTPTMPDEEVLRRLLTLNLQRAASAAGPGTRDVSHMCYIDLGPDQPRAALCPPPRFVCPKT